jgi:Fe-S-cluster containining protein
MRKTSSPLSSLCRSCGICCNGTLFGDVQILAADEPEKLRLRGLSLTKVTAKPVHRKTPAATTAPVRFQCFQPCPAWVQGSCEIYADRPAYCRDFSCLLRKKLQAGQLSFARAAQTIRLARHRANQIEKLLLTLGNTNEQTALRQRFRQVSVALAKPPCPARRAHQFAQLTLVWHRLNRMLQDFFYPD